MKLFKRITALVLTLAVIAMFGISASAASFREERIFGDFQAGAIFEGNLTSSTVDATATFIANGGPNVIQYQRIQISCTSIDRAGDMYVGGIDETAENLEEFFITPRYAPSGQSFISATYRYTAYYIANGGVDCYLSHGPEVLSIP